MTAPSRWFIREWHIDPTGEGADEQEDKSVVSRDEALHRARVKRRAGRNAAAFERRGIRIPDHVPTGVDPPWFHYDFEEFQIDEDET